MAKTDHFPSPFVAQKRGVLISSLMLRNPIFCPRYSLFAPERNCSQKFLSLQEIVISMNFLTPRPSERKSGTSHAKPARASAKSHSIGRPIGHFPVYLSLHFKPRLSGKSSLWKSVFIYIEIGTNYRNKNFALRVALKDRLRGTQARKCIAVTKWSASVQ